MRSSPSLLTVEASGLSECLDRLAARKREDRPLATYRLQFHKNFRFEDARKLLPYLRDLGITHCYSSPILKARSGSTHGYDITDHAALNPEIGSEEEFHQFVAEVKSQGMGLILDIVPNHMGIGQGSNPWWQDVLENGRTSQYAEYFDIDWEPLKQELHNKVLLPVLGAQYGEELEQGHIRLDFDGSNFFAQYYENRLPIDPQTIPMMFEPLGDLRLQRVEPPLSEADRSELGSVLFELRQLPHHTSADTQLIKRRRRDAPALKQRLAELAGRSAAVRSLIAVALKQCNGAPGTSRSFDCLHRLLDAQAYRLAHWRVSAEEINYRRFFDINELIGVRMENPAVFAATHRMIRKMLAEGCVQGLRIDHPDGLLNPPQYFMRLQMLYAASQCCGPKPTLPVAENGIEIDVQTLFGQHDWMSQRPPLYVLVEKILQPGEELPHWPVDGTVGYDFCNLLNGVFIDARNERALTNLYHRFINGVVDVDTLIYDSKKTILDNALAGEVGVLTHILDEISNSDRRVRDFTRSSLRTAIRETIACFPVYRTYVDERGNISDRDRSYIVTAVARAKRRNPGSPGALFDFLRDILLLRRDSHDGSAELYRKRLYFTLKFQQLTAPVMAKGLEDTACYVYNRLVSVNEVGGTPRQFGVSVDDFHTANLERLVRTPFSMLSTSTHDSKRSEDVRARLNVLSEMPRQWSSQVLRWRRAHRGKKPVISDGRVVPDFNEEYLLYQTLVGTVPFNLAEPGQREEYIDRIQKYMDKAVHEAKVNLSWVNDNPEYLEALRRFIAAILEDGGHRRGSTFLQQVEQFVAGFDFYGAVNSLAQVVLKIMAPGMPDLYRGTELWDFSLVDPDNRRRVDFEVREKLMKDLQERASGDLVLLTDELVRSYRDGRIKLWTTMRALQFRRDHPNLFQSGSYIPLSGAVEKQEHLIAFARATEREMAIVAAPRLAYTVARSGGWGKAELVLPPAAVGLPLRNVFTGEELRVGNNRSLMCVELFAHFPVAVLGVVL